MKPTPEPKPLAKGYRIVGAGRRVFDTGKVLCGLLLRATPVDHSDDAVTIQRVLLSHHDLPLDIDVDAAVGTAAAVLFCAAVVLGS